MITILAVPLLAAVLAQDDVCHVDLISVDARSDHFESQMVAEVVALNLSPIELADIRFEVSFHDARGHLGSIGPVSVAKMAPRRGTKVTLRDNRLIPDYTHTRVSVAYTVEGKEHAFEFIEQRLQKGKLYSEPEEGCRLGPAGLQVVPGKWNTEGKKAVYTGDTLFLLLQVEELPEKDRPVGTIEVTFYVGDKKQGTVKRQIEAGHWKLNARDIPAADANVKIVAYDVTTKRLHIGLCRVEENDKLDRYRLDVKFTWKKKNWTWAGLDSPHMEVPRAPDSEKK